MIKVLIAPLPKIDTNVSCLSEKKARSLSVIKYESNLAYINEILKKKNIAARTESVTGFVLLDMLMGEAGISDCVLARNKNGRPYALCDKKIDFNISHTHSFVVCALCDSPNKKVGIDIEEISQNKISSEKLIDRFFSENEKAYYQSATDKPLAFAELWTKKEAYLKYKGVGIGESFSVSDVTFLSCVAFTSVLVDGNNFVTVCSDSDNVTFERCNAPVF